MYVYIRRIKNEWIKSKSNKMKFLDKIRIGLYHASYHRNLKNAEKQKDKQDIKKFQKYIYQAEDAWKKLVIIRKKYQDE